ncbi:MAG: hypothetical protein GIKADHBN_02624 [Phycisphaerales bacterium]|nr:hypothetical protein [Phycisphaerales bacterium]
MKCLSMPALAVLASSAAYGDLIPLSGTQSSSGWVYAITNMGGSVEGTYALEAEDPIASWIPDDQFLERTATFEDVWGRASIRSSFVSTISPTRVVLNNQALANTEVSSKFSAGAEFESWQIFHFTFSLSAPAEVVLYAQVGRNPAGWGEPGPFSLRFGREGDAPIINFAYTDYSSMAYNEFLPPTAMVLPAGTYSVAADGHATNRSTGNHGSYSDFMQFDLQVIPGPASVAVLAAAVLPIWTRRRAAR